MKKKDVKIFFNAIKDGDLPKVTELIDSDKTYLTICNSAPPKNEDGQSGLQLAFRKGRFDIAQLLIDNGADVNFIEDSDINEWRAPVLHDCIRAVMFNTLTLQKNTSKFDAAFSVFRLMLSKKADPNAVDSYGNNCLNRAFLDARQIIDHPLADFTNGILLNQVQSVFRELINAGADPDFSSANRSSLRETIINYRFEQYHLI